MVEQQDSPLDATFHALAHPTRRAMLGLLAKTERTVSELAEPFDVSLAAASKHVSVLEKARLVRRSVRGRTHTLRLAAARLDEASEWVRDCRKTWTRNFDRLETALEELATSRGTVIRKEASRSRGKEVEKR